MNISELELFLHLADTLHFGRTGDACHLSPSAVSRAISRLEDETGRRLFLRDNRTVELTQEGKIFQEFARETLAGWSRFQERVMLQDGDLAGETSLYCTVTACYSILPSLLSHFRSAYPKIHIKLQTGDAAQAIAQVMESKVDISIAPYPDTLPGQLAFRGLMETPLVWIIPAMPCAVRDMFMGDTVDFAEVPMILSGGELARRRIDAWFAAKKIDPLVYAVVAGNEAIIAMVGLGLGAGVLPRLVVESSPLKDRIEIVPIDPPVDPYHLGLCVLKRRLASPLVRAFWEMDIPRSVTE